MLKPKNTVQAAPRVVHLFNTNQFLSDKNAPRIFYFTLSNHALLALYITTQQVQLT